MTRRRDRRKGSPWLLLTTLGLLVAVLTLSACTNSSQADTTDVSTEGSDSAERRSLPRLLDLGATRCIPCKLMAPILEELSETKKDYFEVLFIDVWENRDKGREYGVSAIPTQIFFAANGEELYRHVGFYSREQILGKWRDLGIEVGE